MCPKNLGGANERAVRAPNQPRNIEVRPAFALRGDDIDTSYRLAISQLDDMDMTRPQLTRARTPDPVFSFSGRWMICRQGQKICRDSNPIIFIGFWQRHLFPPLRCRRRAPAGRWTPPPSRCVFASRHLPRCAGEEKVCDFLSSPVKRGRWRVASSDVTEGASLPLRSPYLSRCALISARPARATTRTGPLGPRVTRAV